MAISVDSIAVRAWRSTTIGAVEPAMARLRRRGATLRRLASAFGPAAAPLLLALLALPHVLPVSIPGTGIAFAAPMLFIAISLLRHRRRLVLPSWIGQRRLEARHLDWILSKLDRLLAVLERFSRPRLAAMLGTGMLIGAVVAIGLMVLLIMLPVPTGNLPAAASMVSFAVGLLRRDGLLMLAGHVVAVVAVAWNVALATLIFAAGFEIWSIL